MKTLDPHNPIWLLLAILVSFFFRISSGGTEIIQAIYGRWLELGGSDAGIRNKVLEEAWLTEGRPASKAD